MLSELPLPRVVYSASLDLSECSAESFETALRDLATWLGQAPVSASICIKPAPQEWVQLVCNCWQTAADFMTPVDTLLDMIGESHVKMRLVLGCTRQHPFARKAMAQAPHAVWGAHYQGVALCYNCNNRYSVWHEALHTLNAQDCYECQTKQPTCNCTQCLMQYAPDERTVGQSPQLCEANQARVWAGIQWDNATANR